MKRCKICHVEAELEDGRCHSCRMAYEATDVYHTTYGKYAAMISHDKQQQSAQPRQTPDVRTRNCAWCGKPFPRFGRKIYCSDICYRNKNYAAERKHHGKEFLLGGTKTCLVCGKEFTPKRSDAKYCSRACTNSTKAIYMRMEAKKNDRPRTDY